MSVLDNAHKGAVVNPDRKIWCDEDRHKFFENFPDFNEWIDSDEGVAIRLANGIDGLTQPSKAFYASDPAAYNQAFLVYQNENRQEVLSKEYIFEQYRDYEWYDYNISRFEQLLEAFEARLVVPFIGAGISAAMGFPSWKQHIVQQGAISGLDARDVSDLLAKGQYETVIEEIEKMGRRDAFIQGVKDVFNVKKEITETLVRVIELFPDRIITTNYDRQIEKAIDAKGNDIQILDVNNILDRPDENKTTLIKLHGDIIFPSQCIISKEQYQNAYGPNKLDLSKQIPTVLKKYFSKTSLLFIGCSLNHDRTMDVFQVVKDEIGNINRPPHFSIESMPYDKAELIVRNAYLLSFGITPIWFPKGGYEYIEQILMLVRNELRYRGCKPGEKGKYIPTVDGQKENITTPVKIGKNGILKFIQNILESTTRL